jgi:hypothetical protein
MGNKQSKINKINSIINGFEIQLEKDKIYLDTTRFSLDKDYLDKLISSKKILLHIIDSWKIASPQKKLNIINVVSIDLQKAFDNYTSKFNSLIVQSSQFGVKSL